jgi:peptidoglycan/xylan/chitin deacetylase (PgdA/CDA1 family)
MSGMRAPLPLLAAGAAWSLPALAPIAEPVSAALRVARRHDGPPDGVAVTFDDGPHPAGTPRVLGTLERAGASATFFLVGEQVRRDPGLAREIAARGHTIAVHAHRHRNLLRLTPAMLRADLDRAWEAIAAATGTQPVLHRPPYGIYSAGGLAAVRRRGWTPLLWSRWGRDWARGATPERITRLVTRDLRGGDVLLLHDSDAYSVPGSWRATTAALGAVLETIAQHGLRPVAL